jgi:hypothetical protein
MRAPGISSVVPAVIVAATTLVSAQWPGYKVPGVPRLPNGQVDMNAPTPRTADGKPDLSGTWENLTGILGARGAKPELVSLDQVAQASFFDLGQNFKGGLPLQPWAAALKKQRLDANSKDNPDVWCLPMGNMQFNIHPFPRKMIQTPNVLVILYETHQGVRQIFLDGRPKPDNDPQPWWYGYSHGSWEGDTLVVETTNFRDGGWLDIYGSPLSEAGRTIERFRRINVGQLEIEVTIDDPKAYTRPFTVKLNQQLMPDAELIEMVCLENNKSIEHLAK